MNIRFSPVKESKVHSVDFTDLPFGQICSDHMFVVDYQDGQWGQGEIRGLEKFNIHPANLSLHYGQSIFEGMKASRHIDGTPLLFRLDDHAIRFNASAVRMCMPEVPEELFKDAIRSLVDIDRAWIPPTEGSSLYIRPFMFATEEFIGVRSSKSFKFVIFTCPVGPYYNKAVSLLAEDQFVRATPGGVGEAKTAGNYAASLYPAKVAQEKGYDQVMWMDPYEFKYIQEVGTMNIFFIMDGKAYTPDLNGAILKGITRASVIQILEEMGIEIIEKPLSIKKVLKAYKKGLLQEVFGSGTAAVISPVRKIAARGKEMILDSDNYKIAPELKARIKAIRDGSSVDPYGWIERVEEPVGALA